MEGSRVKSNQNAMWKKLFRIVLAGLAICVLIFLLRPVILPFLLGGFFSYVLEPVVSHLSRRMKRTRAILLTYLMIAVTAGLTAAYFVPNFLRDLQELGSEVPRYAEMLGGLLARLRELFRRYGIPPGVEQSFLRGLDEIRVAAESFAGRAARNVLASADAVTKILLAPVIGYYILRDVNSWRKAALVRLSKLPDPYLELFHETDTVLGGFVRGQAVVALAVTVMVWIAAAIVGLNYGAVLGVIAGLGEFIPYFGPIVAAIPMLVVGLAKSPVTALKTLAAILIIQQIDSTLIVPKVTGKRVGLHPLAVITALLIGGHYFGFWGFFLAVPAAGILRALFRFISRMMEIWRKRA